MVEPRSEGFDTFAPIQKDSPASHDRSRHGLGKPRQIGGIAPPLDEIHAIAWVKTERSWEPIGSQLVAGRQSDPSRLVAD